MQKKAIILYGPPGVGKLSTAKELSKITNFDIFHVHEIADLVSSSFETGTKAFTEKFEELWFSAFKKNLESSKEGLIVTLIYGIQTFKGKEDASFFLKVKETAKKKNIEIFFIKLKCENEELKKRITSKEREKYKKLTSYKALQEIRKKYKVDNKIPFLKSKTIDTSKMTPSEVALKIKKSIFKKDA